MADKIDKLTDEIAETYREIYESTENGMITAVNKALAEPLKSGSSFASEQATKKAKLRKELLAEAEKSAKLLETITKNAGKMAGFQPKIITKENQKAEKLLLESALSYFTKSVVAIRRLEKVIPISEAIFKQTQQGIQNGIPILTKSGKTWGYKEYMEMNVRTTIQKEIGDTQLAIGKESHAVFYICNSFGDCANDHKDYQGKIYYDERYKSYGLTDEALDEVEAYIKGHNLLTIQEVRDGDPWLTTRPNCRHRFTALSVDQVLTKRPQDIIKALKLERGTYKDENYEATQAQRYNERQIRFFKDRKAQNETLRDQVAKGSELERLYRRQILKDNVIVKRWQAKQRELIDSNPNLDRDYRRETRNILLNDLGAKSKLARSEQNAP